MNDFSSSEQDQNLQDVLGFDPSAKDQPVEKSNRALTPLEKASLVSGIKIDELAEMFKKEYFYSKYIDPDNLFRIGMGASLGTVRAYYRFNNRKEKKVL